MGIIDRTRRLLRSTVNAALDAASDPGKLIDQHVSDLEDGVREARREVLAALTAEKTSRQRLTALEGTIGSWQERAERAVRAGDDALARAALERVAELERERSAAKLTLAEAEVGARQLGAALRQLEARLAELKGRKETLKAMARAERAGVGAGGTPSGGGIEGIETALDVAEAEVALEEELRAARHEDHASLTAERRLEEMSRDRDVEERLAALKNKLR